MFIYTGTFWLTYLYSSKYDLCFFDASVTMLLHVVVSTTSAYIIHVLVDELIKLDRGRQLIDVMRSELDGVVVFDGRYEQIFCTEKA
jgi:hypothetical protein